MRLNLKLSLVATICILIGGLIGSIKSFQISQNQIRQQEIENSQKTNQWIAVALEQNLIQMEASVSYLDKSTVESLKRFGA